MIITLIFIVAFILCFIIDIFHESELPILSIVSGLLLFFCLLILILQRNSSRDFVRSFNETVLTISAQREGAEPLERAALTNKMMELNAELVNNQHYAKSSYTNWFYDNSTGLLDLKPLR